jgi:hypothetical protein
MRPDSSPGSGACRFHLPPISSLTMSMCDCMTIRVAFSYPGEAFKRRRTLPAESTAHSKPCTFPKSNSFCVISSSSLRELGRLEGRGVSRLWRGRGGERGEERGESADRQGARGGR